MTDRELLYIKTIAEEHNITRAAEKLSIAQPSLTQSVQRIEKSLNCSLFHRQKNGFFLTSDGELYYKTACQMLELWNQLLNQLSDRDNMNGGVLNIGASWCNTLLILTPLLPKYRKNYPLIDIRLSEQKTSELVQLLNQGKLDLILSHQYPNEYPAKTVINSKKLVEKTLLKEHFCIVLHSKYGFLSESPDSEPPILPLEILKNIPMIRFSERQRIRHICDFAFEQAGFFPPTALTTYSFPSALELVAQGVGAAILPEHYLKKQLTDFPDLQIFLIDPSYHAYWTSTVCYYQSDYLPPAVSSFLNCLEEHFL